MSNYDILIPVLNTFAFETEEYCLDDNYMVNDVKALRGKSLCEKNCLIFQTANRVLSDKLLGSCLKVFCFEPSPAYKGAFLLKRRKDFFFIYRFFMNM